MKEKYILEKTIKYLNRLLISRPLKTIKEIEEVRILTEELNSMIYKNKND